MPPQQSDRLLDLFDQAFDFRTHVSAISVKRWDGRRRRKDDADVAIRPARCNG
jgi:hypothetical protein